MSTSAADTVPARALDADLRHLLHPFSPNPAATSDLLMFASGRGLTLTDVHGNEWLDAAAGLCNVSLGYGRPELADAAAASMRELSYGNLFFGRGSVPAAELAERLAEVTPPGIERFFYTNSGAECSETTIKIVRLYQALRGKSTKVHII